MDYSPTLRGKNTHSSVFFLFLSLIENIPVDWETSTFLLAQIGNSVRRGKKEHLSLISITRLLSDPGLPELKGTPKQEGTITRNINNSVQLGVFPSV